MYIFSIYVKYIVHIQQSILKFLIYSKTIRLSFVLNLVTLTMYSYIVSAFEFMAFEVFIIFLLKLIHFYSTHKLLYIFSTHCVFELTIYIIINYIPDYTGHWSYTYLKEKKKNTVVVVNDHTKF